MPFQIVYERPANTRDLTGEVFGLWTVTGFDYRKVYSCGTKHNFWKCECACPLRTKHTVAGNTLVRGQSKSCGCDTQRLIQLKQTKHGYGKRRDRTLIYASWLNLNDRCNNPKNRYYNNYGGRGIIVDPIWRDFANFLAEMGPTWNGGKDVNGERVTIDRIDPNSNYGPGLCRWATDEVQCNNKQNSVYMIWNGEKKTMGQWAKIVGICRHVIRIRWKMGWTIDECLTTPVKKIRKWKTDALTQK